LFGEPSTSILRQPLVNIIAATANSVILFIFFSFIFWFLKVGYFKL